MFRVFMVILMCLYPCAGIAATEIWSCETNFEGQHGKSMKARIVVGSDTLTYVGGMEPFKIIENNSDIILAYAVLWESKPNPKPLFLYNLIDRRTGKFTGWSDAVILAMGPEYKKYSGLDFEFGVCSKESS